MFDDWIYNFVLIGSALVCVARASLVREERLAWALIGAGLITWSAADLYYTAVLAKLDGAAVTRRSATSAGCSSIPRSGSPWSC